MLRFNLSTSGNFSLFFFFFLLLSVSVPRSRIDKNELLFFLDNGMYSMSAETVFVRMCVCVCARVWTIFYILTLSFPVSQFPSRPFKIALPLFDMNLIQW